MTATLIPSASRPYQDIDISSIEFWGKPPEVRDESFAKLRAMGGVTWHPPVEAQPIPAVSPGFWAISNHAGVVEVSKDWERFSSSGTSPSIYELSPEMITVGTSFLSTDPPEHTRYRRLVTKAFSPRQLHRIDQSIAHKAKLAVDSLFESGPCDFVQAVSNYVPTQVITDMVGVEDPETRMALNAAVTNLLAFGDPHIAQGENLLEFFARTLLGILTIGHQTLEEKRKNPGDDLMSSLIEAEIDGERLTDEEIVSFFNSLIVAGIDTTRNALTFGLRALTLFPEQRDLLLKDLPGRIDSAVMEMVRYASPVGAFVRRATRDTEINGVAIAEGDRVALWYRSANRDETVFDNPGLFDIQRDSSAQVSWGGGGPHFCLGSNLAKTEIRAVFTELLERMPGIRAVGEPTYSSSPFVNSIDHQMCDWS